MSAPVQPTVCACCEEDRAGDGCEGEFYSCDGCGSAFDSPLPWHEQYGVSDFFYCEPCGAEWLRDGAAVVRMVAPVLEKAAV